MPYFPETIQAYLSGRKVNMVPLALFDFRDGEVAVWTGPYPLTVGGREWTGLGAIVSVDGLNQAATLESSEMTFILSGVDLSILAVATSADRANYVSRLVTVFIQFFDEDWQPLDSPYALKAGLMDDMRITRSQSVGEDGSVVVVRTITLTAQNLFYGRGIAPYSLYTDRDQQLRFPGDKGMQFIPELQDKDIPAPWH